MGYLETLKQNLAKVLDGFKEELGAIRTNRPTPKLVEDIRVEYKGEKLAIKQLGSIGVELPRNLVITPWDSEAAHSIAKALEEANIGVRTAVQGNVVRALFPELTAERREELSRIARRIAEETRIKMRTLRDDVVKQINQEADEDEKFRNKENLQKIVDWFNHEVDSHLERKLKEIME